MLIGSDDWDSTAAAAEAADIEAMLIDEVTMLIGSKPLSEMTQAEMLEAIEELQNAREALRAEAVARAARGEAQPKQPKAKAPPKTDDVVASILAELMGKTK